MWHPWSMLILLLIALGFILTSEKIEMKIFFIALFGGSLLISLVRLYLAKEILVYEDKFQISWNTLFNNNKEILVPFVDVDKVRFCRGGYRLDRSLRIFLINQKHYKIQLSDTDKSIAELLKHLHQKNIKVEFTHSDQEMEFFIKGRIEEYPMQNEKTA